MAELGFWLDRLGEASGRLSPDQAEPYGLLQAGDWRAAAGIWEDLGFPYERARTLAEADDVDASTALEIADRLDAAALAARVRARLRMLGVTRPEGRAPPPARTPLGSPSGKPCWKLLAEGIPTARSRSGFASRTDGQPPRSSILDKLGVRSRRDAARQLAAMR